MMRHAQAAERGGARRLPAGNNGGLQKQDFAAGGDVNATAQRNRKIFIKNFASCVDIVVGAGLGCAPHFFNPGMFRIMLMQSIIFSKPVAPSLCLAQKAFTRASGQHVQAVERLLETWSMRAIKPVNTIGGHDYASGHPGLVWSGMN